jgi:S-adenosylmethionine:tRNA ribosyltransferase-isomerase
MISAAEPVRARETTGLEFKLPPGLEAHQPPEARGIGRDEVRLLVAKRDGARIEHRVFRDLPAVLTPGDLLVVNLSATIPAAVSARRTDRTHVHVHFATRAPRLTDRWWVVELRTEHGRRPLRAQVGERVELPGGAGLELVAPYTAGARLMLARFDGPEPVTLYLERWGAPIRYAHVSGDWPLADYQNVYATVPGSAEMPSAGRPFTTELLRRLVARGVLLAQVTLHCGVSSPERHEPPIPEHFEVPRQTARLVRETRDRGGRVIAVGTTVVRALETMATVEGKIRAGAGWTNLIVTPERGLRLVDGLITGWHEPEASHMLMLEAVAGPELLARSYRAALERCYLWHEFGDSHLIMP